MARTWGKPQPSPLIVLFVPGHGAYNQMSFCPKTLASEIPEIGTLTPKILEIGSPTTLEAHNFLCKP
jgi:hypothetical protein